jgi:non-homologous end joining protein Ku
VTQNADSGAPTDKVVDLMAALEASVAAAKEARERYRAERERARIDGSGVFGEHGKAQQ